VAKRLGWLGPAIVIVGIVVAGIGVWAMVSNKPTPGAVVDTIPIDARSQFVVRAEDGGDRNFVELIEDGDVKWRALVPAYAGRPGAPGIAWSELAVTVRVIRDHRAEIFALARDNAAKLGGFKLAPGKGAVTKQTAGPVTLTDHVRGYEIVEGPGWHQLVAIELGSGQGVWLQDLSADPIEAAGIADGGIWIEQKGNRRVFELATGSERATAARSSKP
jgi:hypothetical protein